MVESLDMELGTWGICGYGGTVPCKQWAGYLLYWIFDYRGLVHLTPALFKVPLRYGGEGDLAH